MLCGSAVVLASDRSSSGWLWSSGAGSDLLLSTSEDGRRLTVLLRRRPALNCFLLCPLLSSDCVVRASVLSSDSSSTAFPFPVDSSPSYTFWYFHRPGFAFVMAPAKRRTAAPSRILKASVDLVICFRSFQIFPSAGDRRFWVSGRCRAACFPPGSVNRGGRLVMASYTGRLMAQRPS